MDGQAGDAMEPSRPATAPGPAQIGDDVLRMAMDGAIIGMCVTSASGQFLRVNAAFCEFLGRREAELLNGTWADFSFPAEISGNQAMAQEVIDGHIPAFQATKRYIKSDGTIVWGDLSVTAVRDVHGSFRYFFSQVVDVTEKLQTQAELAESERRYRMLAENASDVVYQADLDGTLVWISDSVTALVGWRPEDMIGRQITDFLHPEDVAELLDARARLPAARTARVELRIRKLDGTYHWVSSSLRAIDDDDGQPIGRIGGWSDIHAAMAVRRVVAASEQRFRLAMDSAPMGMAVLSLDRRFIEVNPALCKMLDRSEEWLLNRSIADVVVPEDDQVDAQMREAILSGHVPTSVREKRLVAADGSVIWVEHSIGLLRDEDGEPFSYVSQFVNVTDAKHSRDELSYLATHDAMTDLLNRREFLNRLEELATHQPRLGTRTALLYVDIDDFKEINDTYGHGGGDAVLVAIAERISEQVRASDPVARVGGDEFVVALAGVYDIDDAHRMASKIQRVTSTPIAFEADLIQATISVGVAMLTPDRTPHETMRHADHALYAAKRSGRALVVSYSPGLDPDIATEEPASASRPPTSRKSDDGAPDEQVD